MKGGPTRYAKRKLKRWIRELDAPSARFLLTGKSFGAWNTQEALRSLGAVRGRVACIFVDAQHAVADRSHMQVTIPPVGYCHSIRQLGFMAGHAVVSGGPRDADTVLLDPWTHANIDAAPAVRRSLVEALLSLQG